MIVDSSFVPSGFSPVTAQTGYLGLGSNVGDRRANLQAAIEELETGYVAVGAPVRDSDGRGIAAISIGGPAARLNSRRIPAMGRRVVRAADSITIRLGGRSSRDRTGSGS